MSCNVSEDLLELYKISIGDYDLGSNPLDSYYMTFLNSAISDLRSDDISETQLNSELGKSVICLVAEAFMNKTDIANNSTITLLRNKLATLTKGESLNV